MDSSDRQKIDEIWSILRETARRQKERQEELAQQEKLRAQQDKKRREEFDRHRKETDRRIRKLDELFTSQWGRLMESLVEGDLIKILGERGIEVENNYTNLKKEHGEDQYEYDIIAANGEEVVVVEVKTTLRVKHVRYFLEDVQKFTTRRKVDKGLTIYGAVAFLRSEEAASRYAQSQGLFVIRATGSSASIINKATFKPKLF